MSFVISRPMSYRGTEREKELSKKRQKRYRDNHPERVSAALKRRNFRGAHYKRKFGISYAEFQAMIVAQNGLCPIGLHPFGGAGKQDPFAPCLDHDHVTGANRGIICRMHNMGIGCFKDSTAELQAAIAYLNRYMKGKTDV